MGNNNHSRDNHYPSTKNEVELYSRDELIERYLPLITTVARALASRLPACIDVDDLTGVGVMGLIDAIAKYDHAKCDNFKNYARIRIKGAMLDELRSTDWVPRSVRQVATKLERQRVRLEQKLKRPVSQDEVAEALGVDLERYHQLRDRTGSTGMISFEDIGVEQGDEQRSFLECIEDPRQVSPMETTNRTEVRAALAQAIGSLSERQQLVIGLYYGEELNLKDIGKILGVTESRVSQIHTKSVKLLRHRMRSMFGMESMPIAA